MNSHILAALLCILISHPVHSTGTTPPGGKIDLDEALLAGGAPNEEMGTYAPIVTDAIKTLENLPDRKMIPDKIREIIAQEVALVEDEGDKTRMAQVLTLSLSDVARQISLREEQRSETKPEEKIEDKGESNNPRSEPVPPTPQDIRKGANEYVTTHYPENRAGWNNTADDAMKEKDYRTAQDSYKKVISLGGGTPRVYTGYGSASYHLGQWNAAADAARQALEIQPDYAPAAALRDLTERRVKGKGPSKALLDSVAAFADGGGKVAAGALPPSQSPGTVPSRGPAPAPAAVPQPGLHGQGIQASDIQHAEELVSKAANSLSLGDFPQAGAMATRAVGSDPLNAQAWTLRAVADSNLGKHNNAVYDASMALLLVPGNTTALQMRSWSFNKTGKYREAMRDADFTLAREPGNPFHHYNRAFAQAGLADRPGATFSLKTASELDSRFAPPYKAAVSAPQDSDLLFVFDLMGPGTGDADPPPPPKRFPRNLLFGLAAGGLLLGAAAVVYGLRRKG